MRERLVIEADSRHSGIRAFINSGGNELYRTLLKRNYKIPTKYTQWKELAAIVALISPEFDNHKFDLAQRFTAHRTALWVAQDAPIYCLDKDLFQLFQKTDIGDENSIFKDLVEHLPIHSMMLLLPEKTVRSPDGGYIDWLNIHCSNINHPEWSTGEKYGLKVHYLMHEHDINIHFGCVDTKATVWFSGWGINQADGKIQQRDGDLGRDRKTEIDATFLREMRSLVMQCLMFLSFERREIDSAVFGDTVNSRAFQPNKETKERCLYPRWLRQQERTVTTASKNGTHTSPSPHWRRGHWRRSAVGEGRQERKWNWIQPVLVSS